MSRVSCDVVVIGTELCGLCAAALIAQQQGGKRVIVVEDGDPNLAAALGDRFAPTAPSVLRLPTHGPAAQVMDALGLKHDARRFLAGGPSHDPVGLGVVDDPDIRMVVPIDAEARAKELVRVFGADEGARTTTRLHDVAPDARAGLIGEAAMLHEDGFFEKRRAKKRLEALGPLGVLDSNDADAEAFGALSLGVAVEQLMPFVQGLPSANKLGIAGYLAALQLQAGVHAGSRGGLGPRGALSDLLMEIVKRHRGELLKERVEEIHVDGKQIVGVKVTGANDYVPRIVIDATSRRDLATRLPDGKRRDKLIESEKRVQPSGDAAVVRWLVANSALPRGMVPVLLHLRTPPDNGVLVGVYAGAPLVAEKKSAGLDEKYVAVVAATTCADGAKTALEIEAMLDHLLPFAKDTLKARDVITGATARAALPQWVVVESEHLLGGRRPLTSFVNLFRAGRDLAPALGIEGELVAARAVVAAAESALGAKRQDAA